MGDQKNGFKSIVYNLSRINEWWLLSVAMVLFGFIPYIYIQNDMSLSRAVLWNLFTQPSLYVVLVIVFSAQIFLFANNDYFDRHVDALDPRKRARNPVSSGAVTVRGVRWLLVISGILPLACALYFGTLVFAYVSFTLFIFYFYTAPPLRLKSRVVFDVISHGIFINTFPYMLCLIVLRDFTLGSMFLLTAIMIRSAMAQMLQEIRDHDIDSQVERNSVIALGRKQAIWFVFGMYVVLFTLSAMLHLTYEFLGWGISLFYVFILILCISFIPVFQGLLDTEDYHTEIEKMWVGQGRTNRRQVMQYAASFSAYAAIILLLLISGY